ncbi:phytanoyl-CoA dioxygenase family protein [Novosphingobium sp. G106]|uniref:phytanoyl-CoA dioxygenase family protein n=1 Tax=Novosphingobium sp. G106 TaxID=2849500 RepID=UPI001C2D29EE|nr:phytanoyl-CoA dioxygenase family protein [Novosphingobium sp. G106]MBV1688971.1 phytanoyl-CoA dioxygenase family protein [Novosphingobium sp. G106]
MAARALNLPDAEDLNVLDVHPLREMEPSNHLLEDHAALMRSYEENGYLLLRQILNPESVAEARDAMLAVAAQVGLTEPGDSTGVWTGKPFLPGMEESPEFSGISHRLIEHPENRAVLEKILGERLSVVPIVQYRIYPHGPGTAVHQDGFQSPGIKDYKPVWIALAPCDRTMGGLMVAVGQNKRGFFNNIAKPAPYPVPEGVIPADSWATTDYQPGDVLIVHPYTPHGARPNVSNRLRVSFDTRVQSARNPSAMAVTVKSVTPDSITVDADELGERTFKVDEDTFVRVVHPGVREPFNKFSEVTKPGMRLVLVREGDRVAMLRKASEG